MKVLILSCNTGAGHNACARAVQEELTERHLPCDIRDALAFVSKDVSNLISQGHIWLYKNIPQLWAEGYSFAEKHPQSLDDASAVYRLLALGCNRLRTCIESQGYTDVISTHLFPAMMLTHIQRTDPMPIQTAFIATDYTASPGYDTIVADWCFMPDDSLREEFSHAEVPQDHIVSSGIPVRPVFHRRVERQEARRRLGLNPEHRHLVAMCGSMGCGPMRDILKQLVAKLPRDVEISAVCGTNQKLSRKLDRSLGACPNMHIHDFVDNVSLLLDSADLYLTKPGGLSSSEALAKQLPMVLIPAVAGLESYNNQFFTRLGGALTADTPAGIAAKCAELLSHPGRLEAMRSAMAEGSRKRPAQTVCDCMIGDRTKWGRRGE